MDDTGLTLPVERARALLDLLAPDSNLIFLSIAEGSFSNYTHVLTAWLKDGRPYRVVVRRYKVFGNYDRGEKARSEFKTFELLNRHGVPAPEPLLLDTPTDPFDWVRNLARTLAEIYSIPCGKEEQEFLLKGNAEATWFLNFESPPAYLQAYPGGSELWSLLQDPLPKAERVLPVLLHIDYWSGNILWHENEISAVIDGEEAAYGDPGVDAGYAAMDMALMGLTEAGDEFIRTYESKTGRVLRNLSFWKLAAAVRPMIDPEDWKIDRSPGNDRF